MFRIEAGDDEADRFESLIAVTDIEVGVDFGALNLPNGPGTSRLIVGGAIEIDDEYGGGVHGAFLLLNSSELSIYLNCLFIY